MIPEIESTVVVLPEDADVSASETESWDSVSIPSNGGFDMSELKLDDKDGTVEVEPLQPALTQWPGSNSIPTGSEFQRTSLLSRTPSCPFQWPDHAVVSRISGLVELWTGMRPILADAVHQEQYHGIYEYVPVYDFLSVYLSPDLCREVLNTILELKLPIAFEALDKVVFVLQDSLVFEAIDRLLPSRICRPYQCREFDDNETRVLHEYGITSSDKRESLQLLIEFAVVHSAMYVILRAHMLQHKVEFCDILSNSESLRQLLGSWKIPSTISIPVGRYKVLAAAIEDIRTMKRPKTKCKKCWGDAHTYRYCPVMTSKDTSDTFMWAVRASNYTAAKQS